MIDKQLILSEDIQALSKIVEKLEGLYYSESTDELKKAPLVITRRILQTATTLKFIIENCHDYYVSLASLRILVDSVTAFIVVYNCQDDEERAIRHYLYTLDGVKQHKTSLEDKLSYITEDTYFASTIRQNLNASILQSQQLIDHCLYTLNRIKEKSKWNRIFDTLIAYSYWRFVSLEDVDVEFMKKKVNTKGLQKISWKSLYRRVFDKSIISFLSCELSQYVHGTANSYISYDYSSEVESNIIGVASVVMKKFGLALISVYSEELHTLNIIK